MQRFLLPSGESVSAVVDDRGRPWIPFDLDEAFRNYVTESWRSHVPRRGLTHRQLDAYYLLKRYVPRSLLLAARRAVTHWSRPSSFPSWPLDESVWLLLRFYASCVLMALQEDETEIVWFWPGCYRAALALTHDVETAEGLRLAVEVADLEQERGFRSSFNIVGDWYPIDHGIVRELDERGFEIGLHGLRHDHSMFSTREEFERQLGRVKDALSNLGAIGFRSPATHRVNEWLGELPVAYDSSVPHSDPYEPQPGGCCTLWPYDIGDVIELPYTMPQDHTLFNVLRHGDAAMWLRQAAAIEARYGLILIISHPDRGCLADDWKRGLYEDLLGALAARDRVWRALPRDLAQWWTRRSAARTTDDGVSAGSISRDEHSPFASINPPRLDLPRRD